MSLASGGGSEGAGVLAVLGPAAVGGRALSRRLFGRVLFASLEERLELAFEFGNALTELGVLGFEFGNPSVAGVFHDAANLRDDREKGKSNGLTVSACQAPRATFIG